MHIPWDELQAVEAVVRLGGVAAAGVELGVTHTSVSRRLVALERRVGLALFGRGRRLVPTPLARELAAEGAALTRTQAAVGATVERARRAEAGRLVVTTNDVLAGLLFPALKAAQLGLRVDVRLSDEEEPLLPGVVDLALRPGHAPAPWLRGRRVGTLRLGVYRARKGGLERWVLPSKRLRGRASMPWWREVPDAPGAGLEVDSLRGMYDACLAGLGAAVLPTFLAEADGRLRFERPVEGGVPVWLLAASTAHHDAGRRAARDRLLEGLRALDAWAQLA